MNKFEQIQYDAQGFQSAVAQKVYCEHCAIHIS